METNAAEKIIDEPIESYLENNGNEIKKEHLQLVENEKMEEETGETEKKQSEKDTVEIKENKNEKEKIQVDTVADFVHSLEKTADAYTDGNLKGKLINQILKIRIALSAAGLDINKVKVNSMPENVLGIFDSSSGTIAISEELLSDFSTDKDLIEMAARYSFMRKKGFDDKGAALKAVLAGHSGLPNAAYLEEQKKFSRAFAYRIGNAEALRLYLQNPEELLNKYLELGIRQLYGANELKKFIGGNAYEKFRAQIRLELAANRVMSNLVVHFKEAVPELYESLKNINNIGLRQRVKTIIKNLAYNKK